MAYVSDFTAFWLQISLHLMIFFFSSLVIFLSGFSFPNLSTEKHLNFSKYVQSLDFFLTLSSFALFYSPTKPCNLSIGFLLTLVWNSRMSSEGRVLYSFWCVDTHILTPHTRVLNCEETLIVVEVFSATVLYYRCKLLWQHHFPTYITDSCITFCL